jgi:hemoglobin-like flavoprotein
MKATDLVMQSFGRCCAKPSFFDDFYQQFLASSPQIRAKFLHTDMSAQKLLLRQGILNLVMHARGMPDTKLRALGESHSRARMDIAPELYGLWIAALLQTIKQHEVTFDDSLRQAWLEVLNKGIDVIKAGY